jgi:LAGLIDADG DNA endonuclease family protein
MRDQVHPLDLLPEFCHWFVGFFEGEGHFTVSRQQFKDKRQDRFQFLIGVTQKDVRVLKMIQKFLFAGYINKTKTAFQLRIKKAKDLEVLIALFIQYGFRTPLKQASFDRWLKIYRSYHSSNDVKRLESARRKVNTHAYI